MNTMEQSYPLKSYASYHRPVQDFGGRPSFARASQTSRQSSIPRKQIPTAHSDYTALTEPSSVSDFARTQSRTQPSRSSFLRWWLPEIFASILSVASLASIVIVLGHYNGQGLNDLNLPNSLTLNGIIAAIATLNRVALMVPVGSAMSQEAWLWFSSASQRGTCRSRFRDLNLSDDASRGAWGSLVFLFVARRRFVVTHLTRKRSWVQQVAGLFWSFFDDYIVGVRHVHPTASSHHKLSCHQPRCQSPAW